MRTQGTGVGGNRGGGSRSNLAGLLPPKRSPYAPDPSDMPRLEPASKKAKPLTRREQISLAVDYALREGQPLGQAVAQSRRAAPGPAVSGYSALSALIGPNLAARLPGQLTVEGTKPKPSKKGTAVDTALLPLPLLRGPRAVLRGAQAVKAGADAKAAVAAARASLKEPGPLTQAYRARKVKLGQVETQFPLSPAGPTAWTQRHLDRLSERLVAPATRLSESENAVARVAGKVVTKASARARVPIQAGKNLRQEARRAQSIRAEELAAVKGVGNSPIPFQGDEGAQLAHFWWAQLPKEMRNVAGLKAVRGKLAEEHAYLRSGGFAASVKSALAAKRIEARAARDAGDTAAVFKAIGEIRKLRAVGADELARMRDVGATIEKLDRVIAKPPKLNEHALDSLGTLMRDTRNIYIAAGKLKPETAAVRAGLVSRWVGAEPTGEEIYVGHRLGTERAPGRTLPGGAGVAGTRLPPGVSRKNKLVLARTGRVRQSLQTAIEDWQRAQAYQFTTAAKDELARMGEPIVYAPKPGYVVVNPRGHELPRTWKVDEDVRAAEEGFNPDDVTIQDLDEYARNTIAAGADRERLIQAAREAGHAEDLRQVPEDVARRYFAQFVPHRVVAGTVPGVVKGASAGRQATDMANDLVYASLIYANPGYIPANTVANLVMAGLQQGAFLPVNLIRAGQAYFASGPKLRALLAGEVGMGATRALTSQGRYPGSQAMDAFVGKVASVPDNLPRVSAFMHEAAKLGVISKVSPVLTGRDRRALEDLLTNPAQRELLNDIRDRANQAMVDFERLGAQEKAVAKRLFFVWAWTRGATRYPVRFALDHPLRSIALGYAAAGAPGAPEDVQQRVRELAPNVQDGMPSWLRGALRVGDTTIGGREYPTILPTQAISPVSTPFQVGQTALDVVDGQAGARMVGNYLNPAIPAAVRTALKQGSFGQQESSYLDAAASNAQRLTPDVGLARDLLNPDGTGLYPGDATRLGRVERALRVFPIAVDPEEAYKARVREGTATQAEKDQHLRRTALQDLSDQLGELERRGAKIPQQWQAAARAAQAVQTERQIRYQAAQRASGEKLTERQRFEITLAVLRDAGMMTGSQYQRGARAAARMSNRQLRRWRDYAWDRYGFGPAGGPGRVLALVHSAYNKAVDK